MRQIKFRALSMCKGERWVYGDLRHYARNPHTEKWTIHDPATGLETDIDETTIGQYTGMHDRSGKEIYEGDLVEMMRPVEKSKRRMMTRHIVTCHNVCDWVFESLANEVLGLMMANHSDFDSYKFNVVGNIFDNPELAQPYSLDIPEYKPKRRKHNNNVKIEFVMGDVKVSTTVSQENATKFVEMMQEEK